MTTPDREAVERIILSPAKYKASFATGDYKQWQRDIVQEILDWHTADKEQALRLLANDIKNIAIDIEPATIQLPHSLLVEVDKCLERALLGKEES